MPGRSAEVRKTPLGQSLAELSGRKMTRYLWKELERLAPTAALNSRAQQVLAGWSGDGYTAVWALTISELLTLTEQSGASRVIPLGDIEGVVRPADGSIRVLTGRARFSVLRSPDAGTDVFARTIADRAHAPLGGVDALFSADGLVALAGTPARVAGQYLGGFRDMLAVAIPKEEDTSHAYVTVAATDGDVVVRIDGARPQELKVQLGDVLRRPAAEPEDGQPGSGGGIDLAGQVARLGDLHRSRVLTDEEFTAAKRKLLGL